jgi:signal transduction histidine kinase
MGLFTLVLGASLLFQVFYILPTVRNQQVEMLKARQEEITKNIAWELDRDLMEMENILRRIAERIEFRTMDIAKQQETVPQLAEFSTDIFSLYVLDSEGWFVAGTAEDLSIYQTKSYTDKPYFIASVKLGQVYFAAPRSYLNNTLVTASVSVQIESDAGERVGLLLGTIHLNPLIKKVGNYSYGEEDVFLVDTEGTVIAHSRIDLFALEDGPLSLDFSDNHHVQSIMSGEIGLSGEYDYEGTPHYGSYVILETNGWGVVVESHLGVILAKSNLLAGQLLSVNIVLFVIALVVSLVFTQQITTERKEMEERLVRQEKLAVLGQLAGSVGHELRNPLGVISNAVYYLQTVNPDADESTQEYLNMISAEVRGASKIISDLLDFSRTKMPERQEIGVSELVAQVLEKKPPPENVQVKKEFPEDLPEVYVDPAQIHQVLSNLVENAYQAMLEGGKLVIKGENKNNQVLISINDNGIGISPENMKKLFEPLFTTKAKGIGLGLAVSRTLLETNGGTIEVESEEGRGSTFTVILPGKV